MTLFRRVADRFSVVLPAWVGKTAVLLGGGPSLTQDQVARVRPLPVIAVNDAYLWAPWADMCYFADARWWEWQTKGIDKPVLGLSRADVCTRWAQFAGEKCSIQDSMDKITDAAVHILRNHTYPNHGLGLSRDPGAVVTGRNSGFQALNLAILAGVKTVLLLGFDGRPSSDGKTHWSGGHPRPTPAAAYEEYRRAFSTAEREILETGVSVLNCSPGSFIDSFPKMALEAALDAC